MNNKAPVKTIKKFVKNETVALSILLVQEINPPEGMKPIEWYRILSMTYLAR
ncbi:MAG: hypothetical protein ACYCV0_20405 [Desulfitobacteriaceae bacterium]